MKFPIVIIFFFLSIILKAQEPFEFYLTKVEVNVTIDSLSAGQLDSVKQELRFGEPEYFPKADSVLKAMVKKYSKAFKDSSSFLILKGDTVKRFLWNDSTSEDPMRRIQYRLINYKNGFLVFYLLWNAGEEYILFNPKERILKSLKAQPTFIDDKTIYTAGAYNDYFFQYMSLFDNKYFQLQTNAWVIDRYYYSTGSFYFVFVFGNNKKYIKLTIH